MFTPSGLDTASNERAQATLAQLAQMLGCSPGSFSEPARASSPKDTSQLIQIWLAIRSPEGREAIFAFAREVLRTEK